MTTLPTAYKVRVTFADGRVETSPRFAFKSIAATRAVEMRRRLDVASAEIIRV